MRNIFRFPRVHRAIADARNRIEPCKRRHLYRASHRAEHWGFVAIAAVDAFHFHSLLVTVSIWLFITGLAMEFFWGE